MEDEEEHKNESAEDKIRKLKLSPEDLKSVQSSIRKPYENMAKAFKDNSSYLVESAKQAIGHIKKIQESEKQLQESTARIIRAEAERRQWEVEQEHATYEYHIAGIRSFRQQKWILIAALSAAVIALIGLFFTPDTI